MEKNICDSKAYQFTCRIMEMAVVNILFILTCLPFITIGPALKAMNGTWMQVEAGNGRPVWKLYIAEFVDNFAISTVAGVFLLSGLMSLFLISRETGNKGIVSVCYAGIFLIAFFMIHFFPMLARYDLKVIPAIKNTVVMVVSFFPQTLLLLVFILLPYWILLLFADKFIYLVPVYICILFSGIGYIHVKCLLQMYEKIENNEQMAQ